MPKRIVVLHPDGTEQEWPGVPTLTEMQALVGGDLEYVTVLDRIEHGHPIYTGMYVNEDGRALGLPQNAKATEIYQRNARYQHPQAENPFLAMDAAIGATYPRGAAVIDLRSDEDRVNPVILGPAIYFQGWTTAEVNHAYHT